MGAHLGNKGFVADINVTPFVDVMLVLLIIFMVTTPMMTEGLAVALPQTKQVESLPTEADHLVLTLRQDGVIYLDEYKVELEELEDYLTRLVREKNKGLFLQADTNVPYGMVVDIMGRIKAAGIEKLGVVARPQEERNTAPQRKK